MYQVIISTQTFMDLTRPFYRPQGKVMFSEASVSQRRLSVILFTISRMVTWLLLILVLLRGRYASYWNAFLLQLELSHGNPVGYFHPYPDHRKPHGEPQFTCHVTCQPLLCSECQWTSISKINCNNCATEKKINHRRSPECQGREWVVTGTPTPKKTIAS